MGLVKSTNIEKEKSKLSIITVTYQAERYLRRTIRSLMYQTCQDFEYIIIDGASKDRTLSIAKNYDQRVNHLLSEPDRGLYDAMNKGLDIASGEYVWFLNAGDEVSGPNVVMKLLEFFNEGVDVVYGETYIVGEQGQILGTRSDYTPHKLPQELDWKMMRYGMLVCHQSFIAKRSIAPHYIENNLSADIDWVIKVLKSSKKIVNSKIVISRFLKGGISDQQLKKSLIDRYIVLYSHFGPINNTINHLWIVLRRALRYAQHYMYQLSKQ